MLRRVSIITGWCVACALAAGVARADGGPLPDGSTWRLGLAARTFREHTFLETIAKAAWLGLDRIEAFEGQRLAADSESRVGPALTAAEIARVRTALDAAGVTLASVAVEPLPGDATAAAAVFEWVKRLGAELIVAATPAAALDVIEPLCDRHGIDLAIHEPAADEREHRDPEAVARLLAGRGPRLGACCDLGVWQRRGIDTVAGLQALEGRISAVHLHDLDERTPDGHDVPWGTGQGRIAAVLAELRRQAAAPQILAIEYEHEPRWNGPAVERSLAFYRRTLADWQAAAPLVAGWAEVDITPARSTAIMGQMHLRMSTGVRDPVTCTALAVETRRGGAAGEQAVMVSCDLCTITPTLVDDLAATADALVARAPGLDPAKIVLNATHTHAGPCYEDGRYIVPEVGGAMQPAEYRAFLVRQIGDAVVAAWNGRRPMAVSWALGHAVIAQNRRVVAFDPATGLTSPGRTKMYGATNAADFDSIEGPADTGLPVVFLWRPDGGLSGMIVNVPCPSQETETILQISADFWHEARAELRRRFGPDVHVLAQCAAGGDCVSRPQWRVAAEAEMRRRRGLTGRQEAARRIADAVAAVLPDARPGAATDVVLRHAVRTFDLPMRLVTPEERERCRIEAERAAPESQSRFWNRSVVDRFDGQQKVLAGGGRPTTPVRVHAIRLGEVAIVTNCFEMFGDYGIRIQSRSPAILTCVVQLAGRGQPSYLPTARAVEGGGYSAIIQSNWVGPEGGRLLVDGSVALLEELWSSPAAARMGGR
jgi:sugar phosphate isomerase/epimerase